MHTSSLGAHQKSVCQPELVTVSESNIILPTGADGGATPRFAAYGASKRALSQLGKSLNAELRGSPRRGRITVHTMSPGMVTTELLMAGADTRVARFFINVLAETPETVAANLVPRLRQVVEGSRGVLGSRPQYIR